MWIIYTNAFKIEKAKFFANIFNSQNQVCVCMSSKTIKNFTKNSSKY